MNSNHAKPGAFDVERAGSQQKRQWQPEIKVEEKKLRMFNAKELL